MNFCKNCNTQFVKNGSRLHCSDRCREIFKVKRARLRDNKLQPKSLVSCKYCDTCFNSNKAHVKYCSNRCSLAHWRSNNKQRIYDDQKNRYHNDISRRLSTNIRSRINRALKGAYKSKSIIKSLACSPSELKIYLESKFKDGMSWDNYGKWHIDHIVPLSKFDLTKEEQFLKACHYTNLQPLWAKENLIKGSKILGEVINAT